MRGRRGKGTEKEQAGKMGRSRVRGHASRRDISIRTLFLRMILASGCSVAAIVVLFLLGFWYLQYFGFVVSPNVHEQNMAALLKDISGRDRISGDMLPEKTGYAIFGRDGRIQETNLSEKEVDEARKVVISGEDYSIGQVMTKWYRLAKTRDQLCVLQYYVRAEFSSPALYRLFPNAELLAYGILFVMVAGDIVWIVVHYTRKVTRQIAVMEKAAEGIQSGDLSFQVEYTGIREFNRVLASLDDLKQDLTRSLGAQWEMEQRKKDQMAALAHDIKTPLTIISGNVQLLQESSLDEDQKEYSAFIEKNVGQMQGYIVQLIEISKQGVREIQKTNVDTRRFLAELERRSAQRAALKKQSLEMTVLDVPENIRADEDMLLRALMNIVDNAVEYTPDGGKVAVIAQCLARDNSGAGIPGGQAQQSLSGPGGVLRICVRDEGRGFTPEEVKFARSQFYRKDNNRNSANHFGMGLYIADETARAHGGRLLLANREDGPGAEVVLELPCTLWLHLMN